MSCCLMPELISESTQGVGLADRTEKWWPVLQAFRNQN